MSERAVVNCIAFVVVAFACTQILGYTAEWRTMRYLAKASMMAPLPIPFNAINGYESLTARRSYTATFVDGHTAELDVESYLLEHIRGPHTRKIPYWQVFRLAPRLSYPVVFTFLQYTFCRGPGKQYLATYPDSTSIMLTIQSTMPEGEKDTWEYSVACPS